jgi:hypothetical protein
MATKIKKGFMIAVIIIILMILGIGISQFFILQQARSSFDNYYAFRGCTQLIQKTDTYGTCKLSSGETIEIVEIGNKWYLAGDEPGIW